MRPNTAAILAVQHSRAYCFHVLQSANTDVAAKACSGSCTPANADCCNTFCKKTDCKVTAGLVFAAQAVRGMTGTCPALAPDTLDDTRNESLLLILNLKILAKALNYVSSKQEVQS